MSIRRSSIRQRVCASLLCLVMVLAACWSIVEPAAAYRVTSGTLAAGTRWATRYYLIDSQRPGPTVMVVGGVHGDEPAGHYAARQIADWTIRRGRLIVVPAANRLGLLNHRRTVPGLGDLNRMFNGGQNRHTLPRALWNLAVRMQPDWVVDLHESRDYYPRGNGAVGNSIIYYPRNSVTRSAVARMKAAADTRIGLASRKISLLQYPVLGSFARAAATRLGSQGMIIETTVRDSLSTRIGHHTTMVRALLRYLDMV